MIEVAGAWDAARCANVFPCRVVCSVARTICLVTLFELARTSLCYLLLAYPYRTSRLQRWWFRLSSCSSQAAKVEKSIDHSTVYAGAFYRAIRSVSLRQAFGEPRSAPDLQPQPNAGELQHDLSTIHSEDSGGFRCAARLAPQTRRSEDR